MTRKDYEAIAKTFNKVAHDINNLDCLTWAGSVCSIAALLKENNPRFDRNKFLNACGWEYVYGVTAK